MSNLFFDENLIDVIYLDSLDPFFNLACEEYLTKTTTRPVFMLWRNAKCVVLGRGQNALNEINEDFVTTNDVIVCRRISGGGAVFHDEGNVNFTFIIPEEKSEIDFPKFVSPICDAISKLSMHKASLSGRNDILLDGCKVSGNAQCHLASNVMHHGCILWDADLGKLAGALNPDPTKLSSKGIKSVRSRVGNIKTITGSEMSASEFIDFLFRQVVPGSSPRTLTESEKEKIDMLRNEKFATKAWIWGKEHRGSYHAQRRFDYGKVEIYFNLVDSKINDLAISGDFFGAKDIAHLISKLENKDISQLASYLEDISQYIYGASKEDIVDLFSCATNS